MIVMTFTIELDIGPPTFCSLRELVKAAERAETEVDRLAVVRAGIKVLEGHAAVLQLAAGRDT